MRILCASLVLLCLQGCYSTTPEDCDNAIRQTLVFEDQVATVVETDSFRYRIYHVLGGSEGIYYQCQYDPEANEAVVRLVVLHPAKITKTLPEKPAEQSSQP